MKLSYSPATINAGLHKTVKFISTSGGFSVLEILDALITEYIASIKGKRNIEVPRMTSALGRSPVIISNDIYKKLRKCSINRRIPTTNLIDNAVHSFIEKHGIQSTIKFLKKTYNY